MKLYDFELSGNCYKARLFLNILNQPYQLVPLDLRAGAHKRPDYLSLNPKGQVPVLVDGDIAVADSQAILVYLAEKAGAGSWLPHDPGTRGQIQYWLSTAANEVANGPARARLHAKFGAEVDMDLVRTTATRLFQWLDSYLVGRDWLVGEHPTIADIAVFPYIALAHEGNLSLDEYGAIRRWLERCTTLEGFIGMPGLAY